MSDKPDPSSQTQEPTPKKLMDARRKGDVPSSRETGNMMVVLSLSILVAFIVPFTITQLVETLANTIEASGMFLVGTDEAGLRRLGEFLTDFISDLRLFFIPVFAILLAGAISGILIQGETVFALERLKPKLSKISPIQGLTRLFSKNTAVEFLKNLSKVIFVGVVAVWVAYTSVREIWQGYGIYPEEMPKYISGVALKLLVPVTFFLIPIAIADILWQRFQWKKKQMMTMKEVKDEFKDSEGDPQIRGKRAALRRERSQKRLVHIIPKASVIITNPTHFAVALKYERNVDVAPVCVAKGSDAVARRIRQIAFDNDVPMIENKLLARTLYTATEIDQLIPDEHWKAVAEIIGYIESLQSNRKRRPPKGSLLQTDPLG
jgi:flagellar biosynthesis protein FlhB